MKKAEEKVIMYDSPEAATFRTNISGWVSSEGRFWGNDEHMARYSGCTHSLCECGKQMSKVYTKCVDCRNAASNERYLALPFKEYDGSYVCDRSGENYFWDEDDIISYMDNGDLTEIELLFCEPQPYQKVDSEYWTDGLPEDGEIAPKLEEALKVLNAVIEKLPPISYYPSKVRTSYILKAE